MILRRKGGEIGTDLGQDGLGGAGTEAVDARQIHPGESPERGPGLLMATRGEGLLLGGIGVSRRRLLLPIRRLQGLDLREQARVIGGDLGVQRVEQPEGGGQVEEMLVAPGAGEVPRDLVGRLATATVTVRRQTGRIPFAADDGPDDRHPRHPSEVGDGAMDLDVHLIESLLHPLDAARLFGHEIGELALEGPQPGDGLTRAEGAAKQTAAMEQLEPLAVAEVGLASRHMVQLSRVDEQDFDPPRFEQLVDRDPVHVRALHGHRLDVLLDQPGGEFLQLGGRGAEHPDVGGAVGSGGTADPMLRAAHVDASHPRSNNRE